MREPDPLEFPDDVRRRRRRNERKNGECWRDKEGEEYNSVERRVVRSRPKRARCFQEAKHKRGNRNEKTK
jgi:hypothetical protein